MSHTTSTLWWRKGVSLLRATNHCCHKPLLSSPLPAWDYGTKTSDQPRIIPRRTQRGKGYLGCRGRWGQQRTPLTTALCQALSGHLIQREKNPTKPDNNNLQLKIRMRDLLESAGLGQPGQKMIKCKPCGSTV